MIRLAIIGLGHWGPNYLRVFSALEGCQVVGCADLDSKRFAPLQKRFPSVRFTASADELLNAPEVDAVVIATPTRTHYALAERALMRNKHVLCEKPLTLAPAEADRLVAAAARQGRVLLVGHTFLFNNGIRALRDIITQGQLGRLNYITMVRTNLGPVRQDVNALIDLAPHDISILLYLLDRMPSSVAAQGAHFLAREREDVAFMTLRFPDPGFVLAHIHVSWLEPVKTRRITAIGDKKMAVFDDVSLSEPIRIFDKGIEMSQRPYADFQEFQMIVREGDVLIPRVKLSEPLQTECRAFLEAIEKNRCELSDGAFGARVVRVLDAAMQSLANAGSPVAIRDGA